MVIIKGRKMKLDQLFEIITRKAYDIEEQAIRELDIKDLNLSQIHNLETISRLKSPTLTEISDKLNLARPTVTIMVDRLDEKGYIKKVRDTKDRRSVHIEISEKGKKLKNLHQDIHKKLEKYISKNLNDTEKNVLSIILEKAVQTM